MYTSNLYWRWESSLHMIFILVKLSGVYVLCSSFPNVLFNHHPFANCFDKKNKKSFANCNTTKVCSPLQPSFFHIHRTPHPISFSLSHPRIFVSPHLHPFAFVSSSSTLIPVSTCKIQQRLWNNMHTTKGTRGYVGFAQKSISKGEHILLHYLLKTQKLVKENYIIL